MSASRNPHQQQPQGRMRGVDDETTRIPQYRPTPAAEPAKKRRWPWVVGGMVALFVIVPIANGDESPSPTSTAVANTDGAAIPAVKAPAEPPAPAVAPVAATPPPAAPPAPAEPAEPAEPQTTVSQDNALRSASSYLDYTGFSRSGLISQLEYEGYSTDDATYAVDNVSVDWMVQAERSAASYMDYSSFSRSGLIDQLEYEGFTSEQAEHGANSVGL